MPPSGNALIHRCPPTDLMALVGEGEAIDRILVLTAAIEAKHHS